MTLKNAIKKLEKAGAKIYINYYNDEKTSGDIKGHFSNGEIVDFVFNEDGGVSKCSCFEVKRAGDKDEIQSDYFAGVWCKNLKEAIEIASHL